jgi:hypothetical protein
VAEQLGWLPVALAQAGAVIGPRRRYRSYASYLDRLARVPIGELLPRPAGQPYPHGAAEAILLSLEDLTDGDGGWAARRLLDRLAVLGSTGADIRLVGGLCDGLGEVAQEPDALVAPLAQRSLTVPTRDADRTVVHRLIQRVTRDRCRQAGDLDAVVSAAARRRGRGARPVDRASVAGRVRRPRPGTVAAARRRPAPAATSDAAA